MAPCVVAWWLVGLGLIRIRSTSTHRCARRNIIFRYLFDGIPCLNFDDRFGGLALDFFCCRCCGERKPTARSPEGRIR